MLQETLLSLPLPHLTLSESPLEILPFRTERQQCVLTLKLQKPVSTARENEDNSPCQVGWFFFECQQLWNVYLIILCRTLGYKKKIYLDVAGYFSLDLPDILTHGPEKKPDIATDAKEHTVKPPDAQKIKVNPEHKYQRPFYLFHLRSWFRLLGFKASQKSDPSPCTLWAEGRSKITGIIFIQKHDRWVNTNVLMPTGHSLLVCLFLNQGRTSLNIS